MSLLCQKEGPKSKKKITRGCKSTDYDNAHKLHPLKPQAAQLKTVPAPDEKVCSLVYLLIRFDTRITRPVFSFFPFNRGNAQRRIAGKSQSMNMNLYEPTAP